jgi:outer membrane receptor protein involved in Fe transport
LSYIGNAGKAKSQGVEFAAEARPSRGLTLRGWVAYDDAKLKEDLPPLVVAAFTFGQAGERLPWSSRWSGSLSLDQEFPVLSGLTGFLGASASYVDRRPGAFRQIGLEERQSYPSYVQADFRAGIRHDSWSVNLFVNNVTDKRGVLAAMPNFASRVFYIQPRTIGLNLTKDF